MGGKAAVLLVLGFSLIFLTIGYNFGNLSTRAGTNMADYYIETKAHNIAVSGANMAANELFMDKTWETGYQNLSFDGGSINVYVSNNLINTSSKVAICHIPPGNPAAAHTIMVSSHAVSAHLAHGDYMGNCGSGGAVDEQMATIISEGTYNGVTKTVYVEFRPSYFSKFGNYYTSVSSAYPATGDTFSGPFHTNDRLNVWGSPVFLGKTTAKKGIKNFNKSAGDPVFNGGFESGVDVPLEFDTTGMRTAADTSGMVFKDTLNLGRPIDLKLKYDSTGSVTYSYSINNDGIWTTPQTTPISTIAPNGLIFAEKGNIYTEGVLNGKITMVASSRGNSSYGNVYFTDDLVYHDDPRTNPNSLDICGIVAEQDVRIQSNANTLGQDVNTHASMFAKKGSVGPVDALVVQPFLGQWNILGGIIADDVRVTATYNSVGPVKGLKFVHTYDKRFLRYVPPHFPHTKNYEIVSWYE